MFSHAVRGVPLASYDHLLIKVNELTQLLFPQRVGFLPIGKQRGPDKELTR